MRTTLYQDNSSDPKYNAQRALCGRTHYVDDDTLRFHKSRVLNADTYANGLLFGIVTSDALDMRNTRRGFRYAVFDLFGTVIEPVDLDSAYATSKAALKAMREAIAKMDAMAITNEGIKRNAKQTEYEREYSAEQIAKIAKV